MRKLILIILLAFPFSSFAQYTGLKEVAFEMQAYPAGIIPGIRADYLFDAGSEANIRFGMNIADRQDWGEHDNETGSGFGFGLGYRHILRSKRSGPFVGLRMDIWWMTIDWENYLPTGPVSRTGSTDITILQPTLELGWKFNIWDEWYFAPNVAFGQEINIVTKGEEVGQGGISLFGFTLGKSIN